MSEQMKISDFIAPENVLLDVAVPSKIRLLRLLSEKSGAALGIDENVIFTALNNREQLGSTGIGEGIAIPHAPVLDVVVPFGMAVRLAKPIDFEAIDDIPVDIVILALMPESRATHLNLLACLARRLRMPDVLKLVRGTSDRDHFHALLTGDDVH
ncbi:MAG: PTS sugar transporter subunit IIA [Shinella sp.]|nr:PTS sugar transporter subunit IIA [Shinella sp.]